MLDLIKRYQNAIKKIGGYSALLDLPEEIKTVSKSTTNLEVKIDILEGIATAKNETPEEKRKRIFEFYKKDLKKLSKEHNFLRFNVIEYVCYFPKIDPYKMASALKIEGISILFDDSSISEKENKRKERKVNNILKEGITC